MQSMIVLVRTLKRSFSAFMILLTSILVTMLLFGSFVYFFERGTYVEREYLSPTGGIVKSGQYLRQDASPSPFLSIPHCMYWCMTSMTTVGYGDMFPVTGLGQVIAMIAMVSGIVVLSVPITVIGANFDEETREQNRINALRKRVVLMEAQRERDFLRARDDSTFRPTEPAAGMQEINCLLEDHRTNVVSEVNMLVAKNEPTFTQLVRKVVIHSRVFADVDLPADTSKRDKSVSVSPDIPYSS